MPITSLVNPVFISTTGAGRVNSGGSVEVYVADGLFTTYATIYSDQVKTTELSNPVTLDDAGTKEIWYDVKVDVREKTSSGVLIRETLNLDPNAGNAVVQGFNLAQNGSFEIDSDSDGQPDNWTISPYSGSAIAITSTIVTDGTKALEFNTGAAGSGGGTATSTKFPVTEGSDVSVSFSFYATNATTTNTFQIKWYDENDVLKSTSTVTMPASGSVPTSWTGYQEVITVDAAATQGEIVLTGISSGGANLSSKAYFDGIEITSREDDLVTLTKTQVITGTKTITSPRINDIRDSSGNEVIVLSSAASAVNQVDITNNSTGNDPAITATGGDTNINLVLSGKGSGKVVLSADSITATQIAPDAVGSSEIAVDAVDQSEIAAGAVHTSEINLLTGATSTTTAGINFTMTGGSYSFSPQLKTNNAAVPAFFYGFNDTTNENVSTTSTSYLTQIAYGIGSAGVGVDAAALFYSYVAASPPHDMGNGDIPAFIYAIVDNTTQEVETISYAVEPVWLANGSTNVMPDFWKDGKKYKKGKNIPASFGNMTAIKRLQAIAELPTEDIEITNAMIHADMDSIPHPFLNNDLTGKTVIMLDPVSQTVRDLYELNKSGEDVHDIIRKKYIKIGNTALNRVTPEGLLIPSTDWKK